jgi:hypothetical protein
VREGVWHVLRQYRNKIGSCGGLYDFRGVTPCRWVGSARPDTASHPGRPESSAFDPRNVEFIDKLSDCQLPTNHAPCKQLNVTAQPSLAVSLHSTSFTAARDYPTLRSKRHSADDICAANVSSLNLIARKL